MKSRIGEIWKRLTGDARNAVDWSNKEKGEYGEDLAVKFLKSKGLKVISRNWRHGNGEIDIVARDAEVLVFIEVKTRREDALIRGALAVQGRQKRSLERTCKEYMRQMKYKAKHVRFDIVEVKLCQSGQNDVNHYSNIRLFSKHFHI